MLLDLPASAEQCLRTAAVLAGWLAGWRHRLNAPEFKVHKMAYSSNTAACSCQCAMTANSEAVSRPADLLSANWQP